MSFYFSTLLPPAESGYVTQACMVNLVILNVCFFTILGSKWPINTSGFILLLRFYSPYISSLKPPNPADISFTLQPRDFLLSWCLNLLFFPCCNWFDVYSVSEFTQCWQSDRYINKINWFINCCSGWRGKSPIFVNGFGAVIQSSIMAVYWNSKDSIYHLWFFQ